MSVQEYTRSILSELEQNAQKIDEDQAMQLIARIRSAGHIFLQGAGRSGVAIRGFANRLMHLGFSVSVVGDISSPRARPGDLLIIGSGSGETGSLKSRRCGAGDHEERLVNCQTGRQHTGFTWCSDKGKRSQSGTIFPADGLCI